MAVRLNVVMVHAPPGNSVAQHLSEAVVGELIGLSGIDLTLIDPLAQIDPTSTDYLTLDALTGDVAMLAWQPVAQSVRALSEMGFRGSRARHAHDLDAPSSDPSRRIYCYDLSEFDSARQVCTALTELLTSRQVRTYAIDSLIAERSPAPSDEIAVDVRPSVPKASEKSGTAPISGVSDDPSSLAEGPAKPPLDLDNLVDQLDWFDP